MILLRKLGQKWLIFASIVGNIQMVIFLTLVYWLVLAPVAVVLKLVSDPLMLHRPERLQWLPRRPFVCTLDGMRKQG